MFTVTSGMERGNRGLDSEIKSLSAVIGPFTHIQFLFTHTYSRRGILSAKKKNVLPAYRISVTQTIVSHTHGNISRM